MNDPILLRRQARVVLAEMPGDQRACEEFLLAALRRFFAEPVKVPELKAALAWNQERGWAESLYDREEQRHEWFLTRAGRAKEGMV